MSISPPDAGTGNNSSINKAEGGRDRTPPPAAPSPGRPRGRAQRSTSQSAFIMSVVPGGSDAAWDQPMSNESVCSQLFFFLSAALKRDRPHRIMSLPRALRCSRAAPADWRYVSLKHIDQSKESSLVTSRQHVSTSFLKLLYDWRFTIKQNTSIHFLSALHPGRRADRKPTRVSSLPDQPRLREEHQTTYAWGRHVNTARLHSAEMIILIKTQNIIIKYYHVILDIWVICLKHMKVVLEVKIPRWNIPPYKQYKLQVINVKLCYSGSDAEYLSPECSDINVLDIISHFLPDL